MDTLTAGYVRGGYGYGALLALLLRCSLKWKMLCLCGEDAGKAN